MSVDEQKENLLANEANRAAFQAFTSFKGILVQTHLAAITRYATLALQGAFLLNGTVGIAAFSHRSESVLPLVLCVCGALLAILSAGCSYLTQKYFFALDCLVYNLEIKIYFGLSDTNGEERRNAHKKSNLCLGISIILFSFSIVFFMAGLLTMLLSNPS